jgi:hypothetical protein
MHTCPHDSSEQILENDGQRVARESKKASLLKIALEPFRPSQAVLALALGIIARDTVTC